MFSKIITWGRGEKYRKCLLLQVIPPSQFSGHGILFLVIKNHYSPDSERLGCLLVTCFTISVQSPGQSMMAIHIKKMTPFLSCRQVLLLLSFRSRVQHVSALEELAQLPYPLPYSLGLTQVLSHTTGVFARLVWKCVFVNRVQSSAICRH